MARIILAGVLISAAACLALDVGVGVFGGAAMPTGKMGTAGWTPYEGSNLSWSPKVGAKAIVGLWHGLQAEAAVGYHLGHPPKDWQENDFVEEPASTLVPVTVGANYRFDFGNLGLYAGAGGGYYFEKLKSAISWNYGYQEFIYVSTDVSLNGPGVYFGGGVTYALGPLEVDFSPRYNVVFTPATFDMEGWGWAPSGRRYYIQATGLEKDYDDTYVDVLVGVNYYFM
ncbi:MAG TPA: hypothetical protein VMW93_09500 [bacterium]|nr:hypothetical protein [bacterium]